MFQGFNLLPNMDARENVALAARYAGHRGDATARAERALRDVGLGDRMHHRPSALSGGQQQRVAIARALVNEPALLLADEPTGELDSRTAENVLELLSTLNARGQTLLVVTHSEAVWRRARRVIRLADGRDRGGRCGVAQRWPSLAALAGCARRPPPAPRAAATPGRAVRIVALGDSLAFGTGASAPRNAFIFQALTCACASSIRAAGSTTSRSAARRPPTCCGCRRRDSRTRAPTSS